MSNYGFQYIDDSGVLLSPNFKSLIQWSPVYTYSVAAPTVQWIVNFTFTTPFPISYGPSFWVNCEQAWVAFMGWTYSGTDITGFSICLTNMNNSASSSRNYGETCNIRYFLAIKVPNTTASGDYGIRTYNDAGILTYSSDYVGMNIENFSQSYVIGQGGAHPANIPDTFISHATCADPFYELSGCWNYGSWYVNNQLIFQDIGWNTMITSWNKSQAMAGVRAFDGDGTISSGTNYYNLLVYDLKG
jgi:hypothetical protein